MSDNSKISVDVQITGNEQQQINIYANSFNNLRESISSLSQPFSIFSNNINSLNKNLSIYSDAINKANNASNNFVTTGDQVSQKALSASSSFTSWIGTLNTLLGALKAWQTVLTGGLSVVIAFLPEIINFATALFKGKDAVSQMVTNLKALNDVMRSSNKDVADETTRLQMLYKSGTDKANSDADRLKSVQELKREYPEYLGALKNEDILNGNAKKTFDELTKSLYENARAKAALNKITEEAAKILDADFQIQKIKNANYNEKKRYDAEATAVKEGNRNMKLNAVYIAEGQKKQSDIRAKDAIAEQERKQKDSQSTIEYLTKLAGGPKTIAKSINRATNNTTNTSITVKSKAELAAKKDTARKAANEAREAQELERKKEQELRADSIGRMALLTLSGYEKEVTETNLHFEKLKDEHKKYKATTEQLELERMATLKQLSDKFNKEDLEKLLGHQKQLAQIAIDSIKDATERSIAQLKQETKDKTDEMDKQSFTIVNTITTLQQQKKKLMQSDNKLSEESKDEEAKIIETAITSEMKLLTASGKIRQDFVSKQKEKEAEILLGKVDTNEHEKENKLSSSIQNNQQNGNVIKAIREEQLLLDLQFNVAVAAAKKKGETTTKIEEDYAKKKADLENKLITTKIHAGDKLINAVLANSKKDSAIYKAAFLAKKATTIADTIISTKQAVMDSLKAYSGIPFIGTALGIAQAAFMAAQGASTIATIAKQKPGFATGGQYLSDGRGAVLPGYSRTDNTNACLRSGEAVVVSEAMRNPWARNLVSAINVAHGGRDFSVPNTGKGYAIGGIYTDGGNANRYYNQPVNDMKDLANTMAYQMINNFPPIYVDVKDVNNQQNILAQTVNRVNL